MKGTTINIEETIQTINKQNRRIEELCLEIERLNNIIKEVRDTLAEYSKTEVEDYSKIIEFYKKLKNIIDKG